MVVSDTAASRNDSPVRGSLRLTVNSASPQVMAGTDFSIFVVIQNPFDIPVTIHQVQTHIPVELMDVNNFRVQLARRDQQNKSDSLRSIWESIKYRSKARRQHSGVAVAVGTDFDPAAERGFVTMTTNIHEMGKGTVVGLALNFPQNPSGEELDRIFWRLDEVKRGQIPLLCSPGIQ